MQESEQKQRRIKEGKGYSMKAKKIVYGGITVIFCSIMLLLLVLSVFFHCETNIYTYDMIKSIENHTPVLYLGIAFIIFIFSLCLFAVLDRIFQNGINKEKISQYFFFGGMVILLTEGIIWIIFNDNIPVLDQMDVYKEALRLAGKLESGFDLAYLMEFPRNRGITLIMTGLIKLFGDSYYPFRVLNLAALLLMYISIYKTTKRLYNNSLVSAYICIVIALFYPVIEYTSFLYGTLLSVAFASLGIYATVAFVQAQKIRYGFVAAVAFSTGILMHQSAAIGAVAAILCLLLNIKERKGLVRGWLVCVVLVLTIIFVQKATDYLYFHVSGIEGEGNAMPATCTIYMGITSEKGNDGPGSQDGTHAVLFAESHHEEGLANRNAVKKIREVIKEYISGERDWKFFLEKTKYQWLDPTFGARKITRLSDSEEGGFDDSEIFIGFYNSPIRTLVFKLSIGMLIVVYGISIISGMSTFQNSSNQGVAILPQLYLIGGFLFQLKWESLSRYCLGYFIWLLPGAVWGIYVSYRFIVKAKIRNKKHIGM